jgi:hypothetical protein
MVVEWTLPEGGVISEPIETGTMDLFGAYRLLAYGQSDTSNALYLTYMNPGTGVTVSLSSAAIAPGSFASELRFVTPSTGYRGGILVLRPAQTMTITFLCLDGTPITPVPTPTGGPPIVIPIAECNDVNFYLQPPYTQTTTILSGTLYSDVNWAEYASMMTYNYAIYPLECTTLSIANWQVEAYNALMQLLTRLLTPQPTSPPQEDYCGCAGQGLWTFLCQLLCSLTNIFGDITGIINDLLNGLLLPLIQLILLLAGMILSLLSTILSMIWQLLGSATGMLKSLTSNITSTDKTAFPIECSGDSEGICFGLAAIVALDNLAGGWLTVISWIVIAAFGIYEAIWIIKQARNMLQPGSGDDD